MKTWERIQAAWSVLIGQAPPTSIVPPAPAPSAGGRPGTAEESARELARLRLDLEARAADIARLREEFARQEQRHADAAEASGRDALAGVMRALAPTLSQLATLRQMAGTGREIRAADVLKLGGKIEQALLDRGLEAIGAVGAEAAFDPALHQRMSGGDVRDGDPVRVRFVGYRFAGQTPVKALVSRLEADSEPVSEASTSPQPPTASH
jgi:molecular chaperone GrpE (heat shock protein)